MAIEKKTSDTNTKPAPAAPAAAASVPSVTAPAQPPAQGHVVKQAISLAGLLDSPQYRSRFDEMLGKKAPGFISSILSLQNVNAQLRMIAQKNPKSIVTAAAIAATLDLPINPNLGFAHIVPYGDAAQFQMGWKGFVQLAVRTNLYKTINATEVYEGELISFDRLKGEFVIDDTKRVSDKIVGYVAYFRLTSGYEKTLYMTADQVRKHAQKYSKSFNRAGTPWQVNFDAMALKTVVKLLLSKWGILSIEMQKAVQYDQAVVAETPKGEVINYPDHDSTPLDAALVEADEVGDAIEPASPPPAPSQVNPSELFGEKK